MLADRECHAIPNPPALGTACRGVRRSARSQAPPCPDGAWVLIWVANVTLQDLHSRLPCRPRPDHTLLRQSATGTGPEYDRLGRATCLSTDPDPDHQDPPHCIRNKDKGVTMAPESLLLKLTRSRLLVREHLPGRVARWQSDRCRDRRLNQARMYIEFAGGGARICGGGRRAALGSAAPGPGHHARLLRGSRRRRPARPWNFPYVYLDWDTRLPLKSLGG